MAPPLKTVPPLAMPRRLLVPASARGAATVAASVAAAPLRPDAGVATPQPDAMEAAPVPVQGEPVPTGAPVSRAMDAGAEVEAREGDGAQPRVDTSTVEASAASGRHGDASPADTAPPPRPASRPPLPAGPGGAELDAGIEADIDALRGARVEVPSVRDVPPVHSGYAKVSDWSLKKRAGMTAKFQLHDSAVLDTNPFKGLRCSAQSGHRLRVVISVPEAEGTRNVYGGEAQLVAWSEDNANGMQFRIRFDAGPDGAREHPLKDFESGDRGGESVFVAAWALAEEDDRLEHPRVARRTSRPWAMRDATDQANIKVKLDAEFQEFCAVSVAPALPPGARERLSGAEGGKSLYARSAVRLFCGVESLSELRLDTAESFAARQRWQEMIRDFDVWKDAKDERDRRAEAERLDGIFP